MTIRVQLTNTNRQFVRQAIDSEGLGEIVRIDGNTLTADRDDLHVVWQALEASRPRNGHAQSFKFITKRIAVALGER